MRTLLLLALLAPLPVLAAEPAAEPVCKTDGDCPQGHRCDSGSCRPVGQRILVPPFYYRSADEQLEAIGLLYWRRKPSPEGQSRVVFPLYWHFEDRKRRVEHRVLVPFHWQREVGKASTRMYPLFFYTDYAKRGSSLTIVPLFHRSKVDGSSLTITPLGFWRSKEKTGYLQGLIGPYYFRRAKKQKTDALVPLFFGKSSPGSAFEWSLPLNFYWRQKERRSLLLFPLVFHRNDKRERVLFTLVPPMVYTRSDPPPKSEMGRPRGVERRFFTFFPLLWYHRAGGSTFSLLPPFFRQGRPDGHHSGLFPILWIGRKGKDRHAVVFPVYWYFGGEKSSFTLAGLLGYHRRRGSGHSTGLVPIAFFGADREKGTSYQLILPLFYRGTDGHGRKSTTVVLPLLWWSRDDDAGIRRSVLALNYYHRRDRARSIDTLFPLFLRWHNADTGGTTWVVPPFVRHSDPEASTTVLFPLYVGFSDERSRASGGLALGIFYWSRAKDSSTHVLFPLLYSARRGPQRSFVLFPLVWHFSNQRRGTRTTIFPPFYSVRDPGGTSWGLAPLLIAGSRDGVTHHIVPPIFAHIDNEPEGWNAWVLIPFFYGKTRTGWRAGLVPLAFFGSDRSGSRHTVVPPLLFAHIAGPRKQTWWIGPWVDSHSFDERRSEHRFRMFFPVYFHTRGPTAQGMRDTTTLFPLYHRSRDPRRELVLTPVGGWREDRATRTETGVFGNVVWHKTPHVNALAVLPFWIRSDDARDKSRTTVAFPFWVGFRAPGRRADVVFPLFWYISEPDETDLTVFPFYFGVRRADRTDDVDVAFPVYWNWRSPKRSVSVVPPVYWRSGSDGSRAAGLMPLVFWATSEKRRYFVFFPLVWDFDYKAERRARRYYGPFYNHQDEKGWSAGLFPLVFWNRHSSSAHSIIFPVFWHFSDRKADTNTVFVTLLFYRRKAASTTVGLAPIFWTTRDRAGGLGLTFLPLFHYRGKVGGWRLWTIPFGYSRSELVRQGWLLPYYGRRDPTREIDWAMPLFLRWHERALGRTTWVVPPVLFYSRTDPYSRLDTALLLFWNTRRVDSRSTVLFPVFWDFHSYEDRRTTVLFPAFWRFANRSTKKTTWLVVPLLLGGKSHRWGNDLVWFPLLWREQQRTEGYTVFFPIYWDFWRDESRTTVVFPLGFYAERAQTSTWLVLNVFWRRFKATDGYQLMILPLLELARERPQDFRWEVILGLVGYERIGRDRYLKVLWIPFKLQPPAQGKMAWFGSGRRPTGWVR